MYVGGFAGVVFGGSFVVGLVVGVFDFLLPLDLDCGGCFAFWCFSCGWFGLWFGSRVGWLWAFGWVFVGFG